MIRDIRDNLFKLLCHPSSENLQDIINVVDLSADYEDKGYARITVSPECYKPLTNEEVLSYFETHRNNESDKFRSYLNTTVPIKLDPLDEDTKSNFITEFGENKLKLLETFRISDRALYSLRNNKDDIIPDYTKYETPGIANTKVEALMTINAGVLKDGNTSNCCLSPDSSVSKGRSAKQVYSMEVNPVIERPVTRYSKRKIPPDESVGPTTPKIKKTGLQSKTDQGDYDANALFVEHGKRGRETLQMLKQDFGRFTFENVSSRFPNNTEATLTFLRLMDHLHSQPYQYNYMLSSVPLKCVDNKFRLHEPLHTQSLSTKTMQLFTPASSPKLGRFDGITNAWGFFGLPLSLFPIHIEEIHGQNSANIHLGGGVKVWLFIAGKDMAIFQNKLQMFATILKLDSKYNVDVMEHLRHKKLIIHPDLLDVLGVEYSIVEQAPGDLVMTGWAAYHQVVNVDFNIAQALNFAGEKWIRKVGKLSLGLDNALLGALCQCNEMQNCKKLRTTSSHLLQNMKLLLNCKCIEDLPSHLKSMMNIYVDLLAPHYKPTQMNPHLFFWLSELYTNVCMRSWYKQQTQNKTRENSSHDVIAGHACLSLSNDTTLSPLQMGYLGVINSIPYITTDVVELVQLAAQKEAPYLFQQRQSAIKHVILTNGPFDYMCATCFKPTQSEITFTSTIGENEGTHHVVNTTSNRKRQMKLPVGVFKDKRDLNKHLKRCNTHLECMEDGCSPKFSNSRKERMMKHIKEVHRKRIFFCPSCCLWLTDVSSFTAHLRDYHIQEYEKVSSIKVDTGNGAPQQNMWHVPECSSTGVSTNSSKSLVLKEASNHSNISTLNMINEQDSNDCNCSYNMKLKDALEEIKLLDTAVARLKQENLHLLSLTAENERKISTLLFVLGKKWPDLNLEKIDLNESST